jgi:4-amino-4-deoxy-L-arabinose transferase-like glycosyltransferase
MVFLVPLYEAPDENAHLAYVDIISQSRHLPTMRHAGGEGHQPPMYYLIASILPTWLAPDRCIHVNARYNPIHYQHGGRRRDVPEYENVFSPVFPTPGDTIAFYGVRLVSLLCGILVIIITFDSARLFLDTEPGALLSVFFVASLPEFSYICAVINNDALAFLAGAVITWASVGIARRPFNSSNYLALGASLGAGVAIKKNLLCFIPGAIFLVLYLVCRNSGNRRQILKGAGLALMSAVLMSGPWVARNYVLYGDALGARTEARMLAGLRREKTIFSWFFVGNFWANARATLTHHQLEAKLSAAFIAAIVIAMGLWFYRSGSRRERLRSWLFAGLTVLGISFVIIFPSYIAGARYIGFFWELIYVSFIGQFGHFKLPLPDWVHQGYGILFVLAISGVLVSIRTGSPRNAGICTLLMYALSLLAGIIYYNMTYTQAHGRLLLPALPAIALLCGLGWQTLLDGVGARPLRLACLVSVIAFLLIADAVTLWRMYQYWYDPAQYLG